MIEDTNDKIHEVHVLPISGKLLIAVIIVVIVVVVAAIFLLTPLGGSGGGGESTQTTSTGGGTTSPTSRTTASTTKRMPIYDISASMTYRDPSPGERANGTLKVLHFKATLKVDWGEVTLVKWWVDNLTPNDPLYKYLTSELINNNIVGPDTVTLKDVEIPVNDQSILNYWLYNRHNLIVELIVDGQKVTETRSFLVSEEPPS